MGYRSFKNEDRDFVGSPVVKTLHFHCRGHGFDPWLGNSHPTCHVAWPKTNKQRQIFLYCHLNWCPIKCKLYCNYSVISGRIFIHSFLKYIVFAHGTKIRKVEKAIHWKISLSPLLRVIKFISLQATYATSFLYILLGASYVYTSKGIHMWAHSHTYVCVSWSSFFMQILTYDTYVFSKQYFTEV